MGSGTAFRQRMVKAAGTVLVSAVLVFGCKNKPAPEKNCIENGKIVECPESISYFQKQVDCIDKDGSIRLRNGREIKLQLFIPTTVRIKVLKLPDTKGMYDVELTSLPSKAVRGHTKAMDCAPK